MNNNKKLASQWAVAVAVATLIGTSAFADSRHHDGTIRREGAGRGEGRTFERHDRGSDSSHQREQFRNEQPQQSQQQPVQQFDRSSRDRGSRDRQTVDQRSFERGDRTFERDRNRTFERDRNRTFDNNRNSDRNFDRNRGSVDSFRGSRGGFDNRSHFRGTPSYYNGRISHVDHWNGGFRVYIGGARYPFFVPSAYFRADRFRIGLSIRLGGYYNPLGYYDYYDPYYASGAAVSAGALRGVVETVDYRRGTFELRDDVSGSFVTVVMRGRDRDFEYIRPGDYIEVAGDWTRGVFEGYRADILNDGRYRGY